MSAPSLSLRGEVRRGACALRVPGLVLAPGITWLIGRSGVGKSTLLEAVLGTVPLLGQLEWSSAGEREVWQQDNRAIVPLERRRIGWVSQRPSLFPHLSVWRNVGFGCERSGRDERAAEALRQVGLWQWRDQMPQHLSAGQTQRAQLARALCHQSRVLLLDEPLANLDSQSQDELLKTASEAIQQRQLVALLVTHDERLLNANTWPVVRVNQGVVS